MIVELGSATVPRMSRLTISKIPPPPIVDKKSGHTLPQIDAAQRYTWRTALRKQVGVHGENIWKILLAIAEGEAIESKLPDGRIGPPIIPSASDRVRAATSLAHMLFGKPVTQTDVTAAEADASAVEAVRALDDSTLAERARSILASGLARLDSAKEVVEASDAEFEDTPTEES